MNIPGSAADGVVEQRRNWARIPQASNLLNDFAMVASTFSFSFPELN